MLIELKKEYIIDEVVFEIKNMKDGR